MSGTSRVVLESKERFTLELLEEVIKLCGGVAEMNFRVGEVREVVVQEASKN